jgi:mono/diheme cytochrome c family protein
VTAFNPRQGWIILSCIAGGLGGCRGQSSEDPPVLLERNMYDSERYNPEAYSQFFPDHRTMRVPVEGTVARDRYEDDPEFATGLLADRSAYAMTIPQAVVQRGGGLEKMLARGQERFGIYCAPCHGLTGDGKGMVICKRDKVTDPCESRGFPPLPSYEDPRIRFMPDGQLFATITHGVRTMPAYGPQIPIADRWAVVSYVRALQVSQMAVAKQSQPEPKK